MTDSPRDSETPPRPRQIRVIAICILRRGPEILVFEGFDRVKGTFYYRPLGGAVEPGESSVEAIRREVREETGYALADPLLLGVLENRFELDGVPHHEVVFVYEGRFADAAAYERDHFEIVEPGEVILPASWRRLDQFDSGRRLVPEGLLAFFEPPGEEGGST